MNLFCFGLGYCARDFIARYGGSFDSIGGTIRAADTAEPWREAGIDTFVFNADTTDPGVAPALTKADVLLISIPPNASTDPVLARFGRTIAQLPQPLTIIYLSTIGVYGDRGGDWVDEERVPTPKQERSIVRLRAEKTWIAMAKDERKTVQILRLAGIYGPGRNALAQLREGTARRIIKPGQVFNRIHVADISAAIAAAIAYRDGSDIWNVSDDEPAPPQDVITYAAELMQVPPPPEQDLDTAPLSALARSFYDENKRASNAKLKEKLGITLAYPTYREGITALWEEGEGRG